MGPWPHFLVSLFLFHPSARLTSFKFYHLWVHFSQILIFWQSVHDIWEFSPRKEKNLWDMETPVVLVLSNWSLFCPPKPIWLGVGPHVEESTDQTNPNTGSGDADRRWARGSPILWDHSKRWSYVCLFLEWAKKVPIVQKRLQGRRDSIENHALNQIGENCDVLWSSEKSFVNVSLFFLSFFRHRSFWGSGETALLMLEGNRFVVTPKSADASHSLLKVGEKCGSCRGAVNCAVKMFVRDVSFVWWKIFEENRTASHRKR